jgi:drug/metabolite transporter (DMT)-like permease
LATQQPKHGSHTKEGNFSHVKGNEFDDFCVLSKMIRESIAAVLQFLKIVFGSLSKPIAQQLKKLLHFCSFSIPDMSFFSFRGAATLRNLPLSGVHYMLLASFVFALMNVFVKWIAHIPAIEIVFFRSLIALILSFAALRSQGVYIWGNNRLMLLSRGMFGATSLILFFITLQNMPLASATVIHYVAPIFTAILAAFFLKEKVYPLQWAFFLMSFAGILCIKSFDARLSWLYVGLGVAASFAASMAYNTIRKMSQTEHSLVIVFYFPLVATPVAALLMLSDWVWPQGSDFFFLLMVGLLAQIAQVWLTRAYQRENAATVASVSYFGIVYALGLGFVFFNESFSLQSILGMALVIGGVLLNLLYKHYRQQAQAKKVKA